MDKKNVPASMGRPRFFEIFKTRCSESDLGPISLNWFEELSSEALPYDCKISEDAESDCLDQCTFKMPKKKLFTNSQLASTPIIFKERSISVSEAFTIRTKLDQSNELISPPANTCLSASPAVLREICRTPLENKYVLNGSVLCTPKVFQAQTPNCISASLGAEADPEMSWSSSLATPPTLSPTVVIAKGDQAASGTKQHNEKLALVMQSLLSEYSRDPGKNSVNIASTGGIEHLCSETDSKNQSFRRLLDGQFGIDKLPNKSNVNQKPSNVSDDEEMHEETDSVGKTESGISECLVSGKTLQKEMKTAKWSAKKYSDKVKHDDLQENKAVKRGSKDFGREEYETKLNSSKYNLQTTFMPSKRTQCHSMDQNSVQEEMSSSVLSAWSQLDFSGLEITQLEKVSSYYGRSPSNVYVKNHSEDHLPFIVKECANTLESRILNTSSLINVHKLLHINSPENSPVTTGVVNNSPTLVRGGESAQASIINDSESASFIMENTATAEFLETHSCCHHKCSKENSKTSSGSPGDSIVTPSASNERGPENSGLKAVSSLSNFRRRPKKFVYSLMDTSLYREERTTRTDESSSLMSSGAELKSYIPEVSGTATGNEGHTEEPSIGNEDVEEKHKLGFEKSWTRTNPFYGTPCNKKSSIGTDQLPIPPHTDKRNDTSLPSSFIAANQGKESSENKFYASSSKNTSEKEKNAKCAHLSNSSSFQGASPAESVLAAQALIKKNRQAPLELATQHFSARSTQVAELGQQSAKTSKPNVDEPSNFIVLEKSSDLKQPVLVDTQKNTDNGKQKNHNETQCFVGFKTSSNKQIHLSDDDIRRGKLLFKDIQDEFFKDFPCERMQCIPNQNVEENAEISGVRINKLNKNISSFSHGSDSQVSLTELSDTQDIFPEILQNASFQNVLKNQQPEGKQNLTAHEEAEVTELSNILEETGSQFEFTQLLLLQNNACKLSGSTDKNEITELDINSEARKDGFKESCKPKTQTDSDKALHHNKDTAEESSMQKHSNEELTVNLSSRKYNRKSSIPNALPPVQCTLSDLVGCRSAGRKVYAISSETVNNTAKLVSELDCVDEMYNLHKTNFKNSNNSNMCWNNPKYMKEMDIDWHQMIKAVSVECMMKNNAGDTVPFGKENMGKKSCRTGYNEDNIIHISSMTEVNLKIVQRYSVCMTGNELSTVENNHSVLVSHRFVNREETHCNDLQESLSDLTCLVEVTKTEQNSSLNDVDKKENLNSNQQEKKTCSPERDDLVHTTAGQNILVPQTRKNKTFHVLAGCCVGEELDDTSSTSHSKIDIGNQTAVVVSVKKNIDLNQNENLKQNDTIGFHTASGKRIAISDKSLAKARYIAEDNAISEKDGLTTNVSGIQHAIKEKPNENSTKVRKEFEDRIEKCNEVNCSALHCSSDVDNFICIPPKTSPENFKAEDFSTSEETSNNDNCTHQKCDLSSLDANNLLKDLSSDVLVSASKPSKAEPVAFSTANGKAVRISQEALKKVRKLLQNDCYESTKQNMEIQSETSKHGVLGSCSDTSRFQMIDKLSDNSASSRLNHNKSDFPRDPSNSEFFSTASGKPVQLREESLKKARQLFSDLEESNSSVNPSHMSDDSYEVFSVGNKMTTAKCKPLGIQRERLPDIDTNSHVCYSFSTASGKQVHVSEKALQKVTCFFKEIDDNFEDGQSLQQDHISPLEAPCVETKVDDEVTSKSKLQEKCNAFYLTTSIPKENKTSETLSVKPLSESHIEKYKHPAHWGKTFPCTKEIGLLEIHKPCPDRMETKNAAKHDAITEGSLDSSYPVYSQPPENDLETEASESAKAFMEDDELTDSEVQKNKRKRIFVPGKTNHFRSNTRNGKRHIEEENQFGEPPIKRKLLPEFDRSEGCNKSSLKASKTTPEDTMKDRRKFKYNIELKPVISVPFSSSKERQEVRNPNITNPDHNLKGYKSESNNYQQLVSERSSSRQSASWTPFSKTLVEKSKNTEDDYAARKQVNVFVPPFKTKKAGVSEDEIVHSKGYDLLGCKNINRKEKLNLAKIQESTIEPEDSSFENNSATQISLVASEFTDTNSDLAKIIKKFQYARNLQEMRIMKRKTQRICPQPGNLYLVKTSAARCRIPLEAAVNKKSPASYFSEQLYIFGVSRQCVKINSSNAEDFQFLIQDFFSKDYFLEGHGIPLADGGYLVPTDEGKAGKEEFYRALCDTPGVDAKLISKAWVYNHYRWIIWKLAAMEVAFPQEFASKCLTPERVLLQLKYRYDVEVDQSRRSAIKRITERDDVAAKTLVLCISKIISLSENVSHIYDKSPAIEDKREAAVVELTDGWYGIRAVLDSALQSLLRRERLRVGQKIIVHGAELVGSQDASSPLEAPESLMLKISANSSRRARWYAKLGYHKDPRPFCLPLSSLLSDGGNVGCVDVIIQRVYPIQWMEKLSAGSYVFRNERAEEREAAKHKENQLKTMQALLAKIQAKFETNEDEGKRSLRSRILTRQQICSLQDGAELYEAVLNAPDPAYMEGYFSEEQLKALNSYRQMVNDKKQAQIEAEFRKAVESAEQEAPSSCRRDVTTVMKLRVVDYRKEERGKDVILNIWRPSPDVYTLLKEGGHYRIFHLATSQPKGKLETANIQLTATKKTQYLQLPVSQEALVHIYKPRKCLKFSEMLEPSFQPACSEVDLVGYVVSLRKGISFSVLYLSDESHNLIAVQICADFKQLAIEDIIIPSKLISATNLKWQPKFRSDVPTLFAGDLSAFSSNPKERHLQEKFNELKNTVVKKSHFSKDVQEKLMNLLPVAGPPAFNSPSECGLHPCLSSWKSSARNTHSIATPTSEPRQHNLLTAGKLNSTPSVPQDSEKVTQELQEMAKNFKKRKAMDLLSQVPSPPPVKPICTFVSPSLKKSFQPPRNCDTQHARSLEKTACKSVKKPSLKRLNETCFPLENDFVADEELAMINTQALLNRFPKERKVAFTDRTTYTVLSNSPDSLGETSSQSAEIKNALQDSKEGTKTPRNGTNETKSLVGVQKEQQRQRRKY